MRMTTMMMMTTMKMVLTWMQKRKRRFDVMRRLAVSGAERFAHECR
jgi:hypothetical protein